MREIVLYGIYEICFKVQKPKKNWQIMQKNRINHNRINRILQRIIRLQNSVVGISKFESSLVGLQIAIKFDWLIMR